MRKLLSLGLVLTFVSVPSFAQDDDGPAAPETAKRRFSFGLSYGLRPDMSRLGETITKDGTLDIADGNMAKEVYSTGQVFMADRVNQILGHSSATTNSDFNVLGEFEEGGAMLGHEFGFYTQYDLDDHVDWPLFVKSGFLFTTTLGDSSQSRTLGDVASQSSSVAGLLALNGLDPDNFGGTMTTDWSASWWEIPIMVGFRVPISGRTEAYAGVGINIMSGGFSLDVEADEKYANVLGTYVDTENLTATNYHEGGALKETIEFNVTNIGIIYQMGLQTEVTHTTAIFFELNVSGTARTIYNSKLKDSTQKILTATQSENLAQADSQWFKRLAFPVVLQSAAFRFGGRYYAF